MAQRLDGDRASGLVNAFLDGSPTLASAEINGRWRTVVVSGESNGGRSVFTRDVTDSITASGSVDGPIPLWTFTDVDMGYTCSKPTIARIRKDSVEQWLAIFASGPGLGTDLGDSLYAVDLSTGQLVWQFNINDGNTYISNDITAVATDDAGEEGAPQYDGSIDRIVLGDSKGRVWRLDPAANIDQLIVPSAPGVDAGLCAGSDGPLGPVFRHGHAGLRGRQRAERVICGVRGHRRGALPPRRRGEHRPGDDSSAAAC